MSEEQLAWRRTWKPDIGSCPWITFTIHGKKYLFKSHFLTDSLTVLIFDGQQVWTEHSNASDVQRKLKLYNSNVEAPVSKVLQHLKECFQYNSTKGQFDVQYSNDKLRLQLSSHLTGGVPFKWRFEGSKSSEETLSEQVTVPLLCMVTELLQREKALVTLLKRKDAEIEDMKAGGAKVSRKYLETTPFNHKGFQQERVLSKAFQENVAKHGENCFEDEGQSLYKEIMITSAWLKRPLPENEAALEGIADTQPVDDVNPNEQQSPSWANKVPPSLLTANANSAGSSPAGSRHSSPRKVLSPGKLEEQETELMRREALERKLDEEKQKQQNKPKKKKKKLF